MSILQILAPFDGWCSTLDEVPDPVFAGRMLGDGLAVDPTSSVLRAPCAGELVTLPPSAHAISIRYRAGHRFVDLSIGIDTVQLGGRGFEARVRPGAAVQAGDELIRFDLDVVARGAKSLMTPIVVTSMEGLQLRQCRATGAVTAGDLLFEIVRATYSRDRRAQAPAGTPLGAAPLPMASRTLIVTLRQGLHARPAALLAHRAKSFQARTTLSAHGRAANARSVVAIMALGVRQGDEVIIQADGADAMRSVDSLVTGIDEALRMESAAGHAANTAPAVSAAPRPPADAGVLSGVVAVAGFAVGRATRIERREIEVTEQGAGAAREAAGLEQALAHVRARLDRVAATGGATRRDIIAAHLEFLDDPQLNEAAHELIAAGKSAGFAWRARHSALHRRTGGAP